MLDKGIGWCYDMRVDWKRFQRREGLEVPNIPPIRRYKIMSTHIRAHIRLNSQAEVMLFVQGLSKFNDAFTIENHNGMHRVNAKSVIGVMYTMFDFPEEMYLVNDTRDGFIPSFVDEYRVIA